MRYIKIMRKLQNSWKM